MRHVHTHPYSGVVYPQVSRIGNALTFKGICSLLVFMGVGVAAMLGALATQDMPTNTRLVCEPAQVREALASGAHVYLRAKSCIYIAK